MYDRDLVPLPLSIRIRTTLLCLLDILRSNRGCSIPHCPPPPRKLDHFDPALALLVQQQGLDLAHFELQHPHPAELGCSSSGVYKRGPTPKYTIYDSYAEPVLGVTTRIRSRPKPPCRSGFAFTSSASRWPINTL